MIERYLIVERDQEHGDWVVYEPGTQFIKAYDTKQEAVKQAKAWARERQVPEVEVYNQDGSFDGVWQTQRNHGGGYMQGGYGHTPGMTGFESPAVRDDMDGVPGVGMGGDPSEVVRGGQNFIQSIGQRAYSHVRDYFGGEKDEYEGPYEERE